MHATGCGKHLLIIIIMIIIIIRESREEETWRKIRRTIAEIEEDFCLIFNSHIQRNTFDSRAFKICASNIRKVRADVHQQTTVRTVDAVTAEVSIAHDL